MSKQTSTKVKEDIRAAIENETYRVQTTVCYNRDPDIVSVNQILGYCHFGGSHNGVVTKNILAGHDCVNKKCPFLERYDLPGWEHIRQAEERKQKQREQIRQTLEDKKRLQADMLAAAVAYIEYFDLPITITSIRQVSRPAPRDKKVSDGRKYIDYYIAESDTHYLNDWNDLGRFLGDIFGYYFITKQVRLPDGHTATFDNIPGVTRDHIRETYQLASMGTYPESIRKLIDRDLENKAKISEVLANQDPEQFLTPELLEWFDGDRTIKEIDNPTKEKNKLSGWLSRILPRLFKKKDNSPLFLALPPFWG